MRPEIGSSAERGRTGRDRRWGKPVMAVGAALVLQGGILLLALLIGVLDPVIPEEAPLKLSSGSPSADRAQRQRAREAAARMNRMQGAAMREMLQPIMESTRPEVAVNRPDLAASFQSMTAMLPMESFFAGGMEAGLAGVEVNPLPAPDPVTFLGESLQAQRVVLLLDVSASVKSKMERSGLSMEQLREEVLKFIDQLGPNHLFGIIQFSRKWEVFKGMLVPGTAAVKTEAKEWMNRSFRTTGTSGKNWKTGTPNGIEAVLAAAFAMDAQMDEVFILSDGDFQRTPPGGGGQDVPWSQLREHTRGLQEQSIGQTRLRMLCFHPPGSALPDLRAWVQENGPGSLRVVNSVNRE